MTSICGVPTPLPPEATDALDVGPSFVGRPHPDCSTGEASEEKRQQAEERERERLSQSNPPASLHLRVPHVDGEQDMSVRRAGIEAAACGRNRGVATERMAAEDHGQAGLPIADRLKDCGEIALHDVVVMGGREIRYSVRA